MVTPFFVLEALNTKVIPDASNIPFSLRREVTSQKLFVQRCNFFVHRCDFSSSTEVLSVISSTSTNLTSVFSTTSFSSVSDDIIYSSSADAISSSSTNENDRGLLLWAVY